MFESVISQLIALIAFALITEVARRAFNKYKKANDFGILAVFYVVDLIMVVAMPLCAVYLATNQVLTILFIAGAVYSFAVCLIMFLSVLRVYKVLYGFVDDFARNSAQNSNKEKSKV